MVMILTGIMAYAIPDVPSSVREYLHEKHMKTKQKKLKKMKKSKNKLKSANFRQQSMNIINGFM